MFNAYIICTTPRSGSTLLCRLLASTGRTGNPDSFYHRPHFMAEWATEWGVAESEADSPGTFDRSYLAAAIEAGRAGTGIFGMRLQYSYLTLLSRTLDLIYPGLESDADRFVCAFGEPLYIHLSREDKVAQAVSLIRAEQSGLWHLSADGTAYERVGTPQDPYYDFDRIHREVATLSAEDAAWSGWFIAQKIEPHRVSYEMLSEHSNDTLQGIFQALGGSLKGIDTVAPSLSKLSDTVNAEWIERYNVDLAKIVSSQPAP